MCLVGSTSALIIFPVARVSLASDYHIAIFKIFVVDRNMSYTYILLAML